MYLPCVFVNSDLKKFKIDKIMGYCERFRLAFVSFKYFDQSTDAVVGLQDLPKSLKSRVSDAEPMVAVGVERIGKRKDIRDHCRVRFDFPQAQVDTTTASFKLVESVSRYVDPNLLGLSKVQVTKLKQAKRFTHFESL